jgi:phosphotransferase system HPr-like phosphotransfer protein
MNVQGVIKYVYDNRLGKDGVANKFPNFKFKVGEQEIVLWSSILHPAIAKGKTVSVTCGASKKNGSLFVLTKEDKSPMIQELPVGAKPDTSFNPDELEKELQQVAKDFDADLIVEPKKSINKDEYMFVMALAKSAIESGKINVTKEELDILIKDLKFLFQMNFHN